MPLTLGFDTSLGHVGAAIVLDGIVLAAVYEDMEKGQADRLMPMMQQMLDSASVSWKELERIGVGIGPGNFTGIRISVSAARGLALSRGIPAIGVSLHQALAFKTPGKLRTVVPARRNFVYIQDFDDGNPKAETAVFSLDDLPPTSAINILGKDAARAAQGEFVAPAAHAPAAAIALIAETAEPAGPPAPLYVRAPDAAPPRDSAPVILDA